MGGFLCNLNWVVQNASAEECKSLALATFFICPPRRKGGGGEQNSCCLLPTAFPLAAHYTRNPPSLGKGGAHSVDVLREVGKKIPCVVRSKGLFFSLANNLRVQQNFSLSLCLPLHFLGKLCCSCCNP